MENNSFTKKETLAQVFSCEFCEISKNTFFTEHLQTTTSVLQYAQFKLCSEAYSGPLHEKPCFYFVNVLKRWSFQNKMAPEYDLSYIIKKDDICYSRKYHVIL